MKKIREMKITFLVICSIVFLLCAAGEAFAATYYVSPAGSDSSSGTSSAPFKTIQKAAGIVNPGDTVIVKDGIYTDSNSDDKVVSLNRGGTSSNWITFRSENKWGAVLDAQKSAQYCWMLEANADYIRIEDFEMKNADNICIYANDGANNVYIYNNHIHDIGRSASNSGMGKPAVYCTPGNTNFTMDSNVVHTIGRLNPYTTPSASASTCANCTDGGTDCCYNHDHGLYSGGCTNVTVINNIFYDMKSGWPVLIGSLGSNNVDVINNTMYGQNPGKAGHINLVGSVSNVNIQNNISHAPTTHFVQSSTDNDASIVIKNNLVYGAAVMSVSYSGYTISNNITGQDPKFVNLTGRDFHLQAGSPAIDKGIDMPGYDYDADGNPIVGVPDIGAYEYGSSTTPPPTTSVDTTAPSVPTGLTATAVSLSQINLSWKASTDNAGVSGYKVYRGTTLIATTTTTSYANTGLAASTAYTYRVSAFDTTGNVSSQSVAVSATTQAVSADTTAPSVPTGLTATAVSSSQINLSWSASTDNAGVTGYKVYRGTTLIATTATTAYANVGLAASTSYTYAVSAYDAAGNVSGQSASVSATTASTVSTVSTVIIDNGKSGTSYTGSWSISGGAGQYGTNSLWSRNGAKYTWTFKPKTSGKYDVSMWWTQWPSRSTNVPVVISYSGGTKIVYINQQLNGSKWNSLSSYYFEAGKSYKITITAQPGPSSTNADAVRFVYMGAK